ncbi:LexA family protein [Rosenbergiella nectarea]|uniref:LexA family protein n=1 Tax=Rosenbergiella nectarea TaxID=988801 RepID=UPI0034DF46D1
MKPNSVLVINSSVTLSNGALIVVSIDGEFTVRRYVMVGGTVRLENLDEPSKEQYSSNDALFDGDWPTFFGVVTNTLSINQTP